MLFDKNLDRLRWVDQINKGRIVTLASNRGALERNIADADLVIGAVLVAGGRAPVVVSEDMASVLASGDPEIGWLAQQGLVPLGYLGDAAKTARTLWRRR